MVVFEQSARRASRPVQWAVPFCTGVAKPKIAVFVWAALIAGSAAIAADAPAPQIPAKAQVCMACHEQGTKLGDPPVSVPKLIRQQSEFIVKALREFKAGVRTNPTMRAMAATLDDKDIRELADYFGGVRPLPVRPAAGMTMPKVVKQVCENCHGMTGVASIPEMPIIGGQHPDFLSKALESFRSGERKNAVMGPVAKMLTSEEVAEAASYYAAVANYFTPPTAEEATKAASAALAVSGPVSVVKHKATKPLSAPDQKKLATKVVASIEMVTLPGGTYLMGSPSDEGDAPGLPQHPVDIKAFGMAKNLVTFEQFDAFSKATGRPMVDDGGMNRGSYPAINQTMADVSAFISWLNKNTGRRFRLPSESEWEYGARAGTSTHYWWGDKVDFSKYNSFRNEPPDVWPNTSPVGSFPPNPFGLYDMTGNVFQRVSDCRRPTYDGAPTDGHPVVGKPCVLKVMRGGSWRNLSGAARHATRSGVTDALVSTTIGFRLAEDR